MPKTRIALVDPGGNKTAVVFGVFDHERHHVINKHILTSEPEVEQVLFAEETSKGWRGTMAGGEFCGNAARSLGYLLAQGQEKKIHIEMSGIAGPLEISAAPHRATLFLKPDYSIEQRQLSGLSLSIVHFEGISHAVLFLDSVFALGLALSLQSPDWKTKLISLFRETGLSKHPASGLILLDRAQSPMAITPFVFVSETQTLYAETGCASGSLAVALIHGKSLSLRQPSGHNYTISVRPQGYVSIGGYVNIQKEWEEDL